MATLAELREELKTLEQRIHEFADLASDKDKPFTPEQRANFEKCSADFDDVAERIKIMARGEAANKLIETREDKKIGRDDFQHKPDDGGETRTAKATEEQRMRATAAWFRRQEDRTEEDYDAAKAVGLRLDSQYFRFNLRPKAFRTARETREYRASDQSAVNYVLGGATVAEGFVNQVEIALLMYGGMRQVADVMRTAQGNPLPWPTVNDTTNEGAMIGENTEVDEEEINFGGVTFGAYKFTSDLVKIPVELLQDTAVDLTGTVGDLLGIRLARATNRKFTVGTGAAQPKGIVPAATVGVTTASATAITADEIQTLVYSVDPAYRMQPCSFMMHNDIVLYIRLLKDGVGRYLWTAGNQEGGGLGDGEPDRLLTYPVVYNQHMDNTIASTKKTILFGALGKYKIRDVAEVRVRRLVERYADVDQEAFLALSRHDGALLDAGTHPVKVMTH